MTKLSIGGEFEGMTREMEDVELIPDDSALYDEFQTMSETMWSLMDEYDNGENIVISKKQGLVIIAKRTYTKVFDGLLGKMSKQNGFKPKFLAVISDPEDTTSREEMAKLVRDVRDGLKSLFGQLTGVTRLDEWLEQYDKSNPTDFTKQLATTLIRDFFPLSGEISQGVYEKLGLNRLDSNIVRGFPDWDRPAAEPVRRPAATIARVSPYEALGYVERRRLQRE